jgi:hypothetical protein
MKLKDGIAGWINTMLLLIAFGGIFYKWGTIEQLMFDSMRQKYEVTDHVEVADTILKHVDDAIQAKTNNELHAMKSRSSRDSIMKVQADISIRNAIQIEKVNNKTDSLLKLWDEYNENAK